MIATVFDAEIYISRHSVSHLLLASENNPEFMLEQCRKSCGLCSSGGVGDGLECVDAAKEGERQCREWAWHGEWCVAIG
jgi:hypothetical protein